MAKNKGLGRGLDAIFEDNYFSESPSPNQKSTLPITRIDNNPNQPGKRFDQESLNELADSIAANGLLQPILVRQSGDRYEIVAGERRFRACKQLGMTDIPAIVITADDISAAKLALIENLQREDLNPYEEACAYNSLMEDFHLTQEEISAQVGKSRSAVANSLRLLELPGEIITMLVGGNLTGGHARALLGLKDKTKMLPLAQKCHIEGWTVRGLEEAVKNENKRTDKKAFEERFRDEPVKVDYNRVLEERFTGITGRRCKLSDKRGVKTFQLEYRDNKDLEEILRLLAGDGIFEDF